MHNCALGQYRVPKKLQANAQQVTVHSLDRFAVGDQSVCELLKKVQDQCKHGISMEWCHCSRAGEQG